MIGEFTLVIPVKATEHAKSRLDLGPDARTSVMRSFVEHTLDVAASARLVGDIVVVGSMELVPTDRELHHVPEPPRGGLNEAVGAGRSWARLHRAGQSVAVLPVDLPHLTADELDRALGLAAWSRRAFVADHLGTGTTLVTARSPELLDTAYGPGSAQAHAAMGLDQLDVGAGLRHDVDTPEDLWLVAGLIALAG